MGLLCQLRESRVRWGWVSPLKLVALSSEHMLLAQWFSGSFSTLIAPSLLCLLLSCSLLTGNPEGGNPLLYAQGVKQV